MTEPEDREPGRWARFAARMNEPHPLLPEVTNGAVVWWGSIAFGVCLVLLGHIVSDITTVLVGF
jgi:hypothetical protein